MMDFDLALREDKPAALTDSSTAEQRLKFAQWEKANRMALMIMRRAMTSNVKGGIPKSDSAKTFFDAIGNKFRESEKAETGNFLTKLTSMKFDGVGSVREHILKMSDIAQKLKDLEHPLTDQFLVHMALNSLPAQYGQLKVSYNTQKATWDIDDLISMCAQEELRLSTDKVETVNLVHNAKGKHIAINQSSVAAGKQKKSSNFSSFKNTNPLKRSQKFKVTTEAPKPCYFCKEVGHLRRDCTGFKNWLIKKGNETNVFVCFESNLIYVPPFSWWFDTGCSIHITNTLQGFSKLKERNNEVYNVFVGNGSKVAVESIGSVSLKLSSGFILFLSPVLYVPSMRRNLISASKLVKSGYTFVGDNESLRLFHSNKLDTLLGYASLQVDMWQLQCDYLHECFTVCHIGSKRIFQNEDSPILWHKRLGHISKERLVILSKQNLIPKLDFERLPTCIDCVKGKMTNTRKLGSTRSNQLLEIIHTDVCGPFPNKTICGNSYFVTIIDDFSRYCSVFIIA